MPETSSVRAQSRRVKSLALNKIEVILKRPVVEMSEYDKRLHDDILKSLARNVVPRSTEITGEDGNPISVEMKEIAKFLKIMANDKAQGESDTIDPSGNIQDKAGSSEVIQEL